MGRKYPQTANRIELHSKVGQLVVLKFFPWEREGECCGSAHIYIWIYNIWTLCSYFSPIDISLLSPQTRVAKRIWHLVTHRLRTRRSNTGTLCVCCLVACNAWQPGGSIMFQHLHLRLSNPNLSCPLTAPMLLVTRGLAQLTTWQHTMASSKQRSNKLMPNFPY